jgi:NADH dehydrogenase FAD-containing subunit
MTQTTETRIPTVVVVGGGYAGALCANRLAGSLGRHARVVLVSDQDALVHRVRLHEAAASGRDPRYPLDRLLRRRVDRIRGRMTRIDAAARTCEIRTDAGELALGYDLLVYAVGSGVGAPVPGAREHGGALSSPEAAIAFAARLAELPEGAPVAVVGGGLTAIEAASEIAEAHPRLAVTLLCHELAAEEGEPGAAAIADGLAALGVAVRAGVRVTEVRPAEVVLEGGERVAADATVWAAGFTVSPLARDSGLPVDDRGLLLVDETLRAAGVPGIFGCGDAVAVPAACIGSGARSTRMACATAMPMAAHVADAIADILRGEAPRPYRFAYMLRCISLGRRRGVVVFVDRDDRPTGRIITGWAGALTKELIVRFVIGAIRVERRLAGFYTWPGRASRIRALLEAPARHTGEA